VAKERTKKSTETFDSLERAVREGHFSTSATIEEVAAALRAKTEQEEEDEEHNSLNLSIRTLVEFCCRTDCNRCIYQKKGADDKLYQVE